MPRVKESGEIVITKEQWESINATIAGIDSRWERLNQQTQQTSPSQQPTVCALAGNKSIEVYGMGEWQKVRDEVTYVVQAVEKLTRSNYDLSDSIGDLIDGVSGMTEVLEEIRDELKKQREEKD